MEFRQTDPYGDWGNKDGLHDECEGCERESCNECTGPTRSRGVGVMEEIRDDYLSRSHRKYKIARCCESCIRCEENYQEDGVDKFYQFCKVDNKRTMAWYVCNLYKSVRG